MCFSPNSFTRETTPYRQRHSWCVVLVGCLAIFACEFHPIDLLPVGPSVSFSSGGDAAEPEPSASGGNDGSGGASAVGGAGGVMSPSGGMGGEPPLPPFRVLMVVDDVPISTDDAIETHLLGLEIDNPIEVVRLAEAMTTPGDTEGFDLVVVSSSADTGGIGGALRDIPVPILVLEPGIFSQMGLGATLASDMDADVLITVEAHPIAKGMMGTVTICGQPEALLGQAVLPGAVMVAQASLNVNVGALVAIEQGVDVGGPVPERRASFGALKLAACQTEAAWDFFASAVRWLARK